MINKLLRVILISYYYSLLNFDTESHSNWFRPTVSHILFYVAPIALSLQEMIKLAWSVLLILYVCVATCVGTEQVGELKYFRLKNPILCFHSPSVNDTRRSIAVDLISL